MNERTIDTPVVKERSGPSIVWLIPVFTLVVGGWLIYKTLSEQGPVATVSFQTAEGIEAGTTRVKYKNVDIGVVEDIEFAEDFTSVLLTVQFDHGMDHFLRRNTRFWVVRPQLSLRGARGLGTLFSGAYIEIDPGPGSPQRHFVGLEEQPLITTDEAGSTVTLVTDNLGSLDAGSPVYYRGIEAGEVLGYELGSDRRSVYLPVFIRDPYDQLVRGNTRFWNVSGMEVSMGADGPEIRMESIAALMYGGIAFDTPPTLEAETANVEELVFALHDDYNSVQAQAFTRKLNYVMYFENSVRGLSPGAPVEFKGIKVGSVLEVRLEVDPEEATFRIPVLVEIEPERILDQTASEVAAEVTLQRLVERGLRARLQTGNLLTGQLFVELDMHPDTEIALQEDRNVPYPEMPTIPSGMETIMRSVENFVAQLETVDIEAIGRDLSSTLEGTSALFSSEHMESVVEDLDQSMASLRSILQQAEEADVGEVIRTGNRVLDNLERVLAQVDRAMEPGAPLHYNVVQLTGELEETARAIRALVELLERRPQALIFGRDGEED